MDNALDYVVIALYFAVMIGAGYIGLRRARSADDYLVAGRRLGYPMYIGTLSAVVLGGASTIGGVSLGYQYGISGMWLVFMLGLGIIALAVLLAGRLIQMLGIRYGRSSLLIGAIVMAAYDLMVAATSTILSPDRLFVAPERRSRVRAPSLTLLLDLDRSSIRRRAVEHSGSPSGS